MKILSIIFIFFGLIILTFFKSMCDPYGIDLYHLFPLIIGLVLIWIEKNFWLRNIALILIIITTLVVINEIGNSYKYWPDKLERKLYYSELRHQKPELLGKENTPLLKEIWYKKNITNSLPERRTDTFLMYAGNYYLYFLYQIFAFTFLIMALNDEKKERRFILVLCSSIFLALMLIVLQLRYMQWEQKLKLKYNKIKKELIKQSSDAEENKNIIKKLPNINNN